MICTWLLTSTTYGTWLPGDERGFVSTVKEGSGPRVRHNLPGTPVDKDIAGLRASAREFLKCPPILLSQEQAVVVLDQFRETAAFRRWLLLAGAVMANHFHLIVAADEDIHSTILLRDFKSYASRAQPELAETGIGKVVDGIWIASVVAGCASGGGGDRICSVSAIPVDNVDGVE